MVRPARFDFNEETAKNNYFQQKTGQEGVSEKAVEEFDAFVNLLRRNDVEVFVMQDTEEPWTPDSLFPNNWFSSHLSGELVLYPLFAENRRRERKPHVLDFLRRKMNHTKLIDLTPWEEKGEFLEGTGSMVLDRDKRIAYCCRSPRSSEKVLADFCSRMNFDAVVFDAVDKNGNLIINPQYDKVTYGFAEGLDGVLVNNKWGFIDKKGEFIIQPTYDDVDLDGYSNGLVAVKNGAI